MTKPSGRHFPDNIGVLAADLSRPGALTTNLFEMREAVVRALAEYGAIVLHRQAEAPAAPRRWDFWLTLTSQSVGFLRPGELMVHDGTTWVDVTPETFSAAVLAKTFPEPAPGVLTNDGAGRLSWVGTLQSREPAAFGAFGDGVRDDTAALRRFAASGDAVLSLGQGKIYLIRDTITFQAGQDLDFGSSQILYAGPRDRPAIVHGQAGILNGATISRVRLRAQTIDWTNVEFVGLRVINLSRGRITGDFIHGFTIGHEAYSLGQGYAHVYHQILAINNCKFGTVLTCDGSHPGVNYVNENVWVGGDCTNHSNAEGLGNCYGVWMRSVKGGYTGHDMNRWFAPCYQMGDGKQGDERIPFLLDKCGNRTTVIDARYESGRGPFARLDGGYVVLNRFDVGAVAGKHVEAAIVETGIARFNKATFPEKLHETASASISASIFDNIHAHGDGALAVSGGLHVTDRSGRPATSVPEMLGVKPRLTSVELTSNAISIGFFARTSGNETFTLRLDAEPRHHGALGVALYDANLAQLTDRSPTFPDFVYGVFGSDRPYTYTTDFGGCYRGTYAMPPGALSFRVGPAVRYMRVFVSGLGARVRAIGLDRLSPSGTLMAPYNPLSGRLEARYVAGDPSAGVVGVYVAGDILPCTNPAGSAFFQCVGTGRLAPPWSALTTYAQDDLVANHDSVYVCVRGGRSGISGAPSGTSDSIRDGAVEWRHFGSKARFVGR
jgi:hypothetical protein